MSTCRFVVDGCGDFVARDSKEDVQKRQAFFSSKVWERCGLLVYVAYRLKKFRKQALAQARAPPHSPQKI